MKICVHDNRGNGEPLFRALESVGHHLVTDHGDVLLTDSDDVRVEPYASLVESHERVFLHPHGAGLVVPCPRHPHTRGAFVASVGQAQVLHRIAWGKPIAIIGWHFCRTHAFRRFAFDLGRRIRVLLAPTHAMANGDYDERLPPLNARLHRLLETDPTVVMTVRYVHGWTPLGIPRVPGVTYEEGDGMVADAVRAVDAADLVIGGVWTLPTLAVARGVPTIIYGAWDLDPRYATVVRYPLEADTAIGRQDLRALMLAALTTDQMIAAWRDRHVGEEFNASTFVDQFEQAVREW